MILHIPPPNYVQIKKHFPTADLNNGTVFTYFPDIYIKGHIQPHLLIHEQTHLNQQEKIGVIEWWKKYFNDPDFRISQEIEAYHNQYKYNPAIINEIARDLSSSLYGSIINYKSAMASIKYGSRIINGQ